MEGIEFSMGQDAYRNGQKRDHNPYLWCDVPIEANGAALAWDSGWMGQQRYSTRKKWYDEGKDVEDTDAQSC